MSSCMQDVEESKQTLTLALRQIFFLRHGLCKKSLTGTTALLANHGVAHTLTINLSGNSTLVTAYAVASLYNSISKSRA